MVITSLLDQYGDYLAGYLTPPRLQHAIGVMQRMGELAELYGLNHDRAMVAGLLHDTAKDLPAEALLGLAKKAGVVFEHDCEQLPIYLHGPVGAYMVRTALGITDPVILDAIATHTNYGEVVESQRRFSWCLRFADILSPVKAWHGMHKLKSLVYAGEFQPAQLLLSSWLIEYFEKNGIPVHPNFEQHVQTLTEAPGVAGDFFARW